MKTKGLTLTEIMVSVSIIGLIATVAIPAVTNFREIAYENICRKNLQAIDNAKLQWAMTEEEADDAEPTEEDMAGYIIGDFPQPVIAGALYDINDVITPALCTFHGDGFVDGFGLTVPNNIADLVRNGSLNASDIMDGDWRWGIPAHSENTELTTLKLNINTTGELQPLSSFVDYCGHIGMENDKSFQTDPAVEIYINGKTLKGEVIGHFSEEYAERISKNEANISSTKPYISMMTKGGFYVLNTVPIGPPGSNGTVIIANFYDHKGNPLGSVQNEKSLLGGLN